MEARFSFNFEENRAFYFHFQLVSINFSNNKKYQKDR